MNPSSRNPLRRMYSVVWVHGIGRALSWLLMAPIVAYQRFASPMLPPSCKYHPSCSEYARLSLDVHGPLKGLALGTARIVRCNPWSGGGFDPVPSRGRWLPDVHTDGRPRVTATSIPEPSHDRSSAPTSTPGA